MGGVGRAKAARCLVELCILDPPCPRDLDSVRVSRLGTAERARRQLSCPRAAFANPTPLKPQRLRLLHLRQRPHLGKYVCGQFAIDLDQRDRVAAGRVAPDMESRNIDAGIAERG